MNRLSVSIGERLSEAILKRFPTINDFADSIGYKQKKILNYTSGRKMVNVDFVCLLIDKGFDIIWILTGRPNREKEIIKNFAGFLENLTNVENYEVKKINGDVHTLMH